MSQAGALGNAGGGGGTSVETITGNIGGPQSPVAGNFNFLTANATVKFSGTAATETLDFDRTSNLILGNSATGITTATDNSGYGHLSLSSVTTGTENSCYGWDSGLNITVGGFNCCFGAISGSEIVAGNYNSAFGASALSGGTDVNSCIAIGYQALLNNQADHNIAIGTLAMDNGATGGENVAIGNECMEGATSAIENTCVGYKSGQNIATAQACTFLGWQAGNNSSGNFNTAIGSSALGGAAATGTLNVFCGGSSGFSLTTGTSNSGFGAQSLDFVTTGSYNIGIGLNSGSNYTVENSNICVGNIGKVGESNALYLGTSGSGNGQVNKAYIAGVAGVIVSNLNMVTIDTSTGQLGSQTTGPVITWSDTSGAFSAAASNGYFITTTATGTLPASPSEGTTISFILDTTNVLTIQANTGQVIRLGTTVSASAGTAASNARGDSITLVFRSSGSSWIALSSIGTWTLT